MVLAPSDVPDRSRYGTLSHKSARISGFPLESSLGISTNARVQSIL